MSEHDANEALYTRAQHRTYNKPPRVPRLRGEVGWWWSLAIAAAMVGGALLPGYFARDVTEWVVRLIR